MYNDETPQGPSSVYRGHAKGVLALAGNPSGVRCHRGLRDLTPMHSKLQQSPTRRDSLRRSICANQCGIAQGRTGFWLQHSAPKFPQPAAGSSARNYSGVAPSQQVFGQHFLCLSLDVPGVETVAATLRTAFPLVFSWRLPGALRSTLPQVHALLWSLMQGHLPTLIKC